MSQSTIFAMTPFGNNCQSLHKTSNMFSLALTVLEILFIFDLQKVGQGHGVQFLLWHHSMENGKIYRRHISSRHFADINVLFIFIQKVGHGGIVQFYALTPFDGKCQNL